MSSIWISAEELISISSTVLRMRNLRACTEKPEDLFVNTSEVKGYYMKVPHAHLLQSVCQSFPPSPAGTKRLNKALGHDKLWTSVF